MAVIKGNFKYFAYYDSVKSMREDQYLDSETLVSVISNQIDVDYVISKKPMLNSIKLDNGLYANPIFTGNALSETVSQVYSTSKPVENKVGGVEVGDEFTSLPIIQVLNRMFYGSGTISFDFKLNINDEVHVRGELHKITLINIEVKECLTEVASYEIYQDNVLVTFGEVSWKEGVYTCDTNIEFRKDNTISVILRDKEFNAIEKRIEIKTVYPIFYSLIDSNSEPGQIAIKKMANYRTFGGEFSIKRTYLNNSEFIAIPSTHSVLKRIGDENGFNITGLFSSYYIDVELGTDVVKYLCYKSPSISVNDYLFTFEVEEVK